MESTQNPFLGFGKDVSFQITRYLDPKSRGRLSQTDKHLRDLVSKYLEDGQHMREYAPELQELTGNLQLTERTAFYKRAFTHLNEAKQIYGAQASEYRYAQKVIHHRNSLEDIQMTSAFAVIGIWIATIGACLVKRSFDPLRKFWKADVALSCAACGCIKILGRETTSAWRVHAGLRKNVQKFELRAFNKSEWKKYGRYGAMDHQCFEAVWVLLGLQQDAIRALGNDLSTKKVTDPKYNKSLRSIQSDKNPYDQAYFRIAYRLQRDRELKKGVSVTPLDQFSLKTP